MRSMRTPREFLNWALRVGVLRLTFEVCLDETKDHRSRNLNAHLSRTVPTDFGGRQISSKTAAAKAREYRWCSDFLAAMHARRPFLALAGADLARVENLAHEDILHDRQAAILTWSDATTTKQGRAIREREGNKRLVCGKQLACIRSTMSPARLSRFFSRKFVALYSTFTSINS